MAQFADHTLVAQPPHETAEAQNAHGTEEPLRAFAQHAVALRHVLYEDTPLNEMEVLFIENHFPTLEMAFLRWKRQHGTIRHY